jgi:repressor LexA
MKPLTAEQQKVFDYVVDFQHRNGMPPTVREIAAHFGYRSPNAAGQHLRLIERKGYLRRRAHRARGLHVEGQTGGATRAARQVPVVGAIAAGQPLTAVQNLEATVTLDADLFGGEDLFCLRVRGDSMNGAGILDGDLAVVRRQQRVDNGAIAAVVIEEDATLKRVFLEGRRLVLRADNPSYADIVVEPGSRVTVAGKLVGVVRTRV